MSYLRKDFSRPSLQLCTLLLSHFILKLCASGTATSGIQLSTNSASYQAALASCSILYGPQYSLANVSSTATFSAVQSVCGSKGCWVAGAVIAAAGSQPELCPHLSSSYSTVQAQPCTMDEKFSCSVTSMKPLPPLPTPPPTPVHHTHAAKAKPSASATSSFPRSPSPSPLRSPPTYPKPPIPKPPLPRPPSPPLFPPPSPPTLSPPNTPPAPGSTYESSFELLTQPSEVVAVHLVHIPNSDTYLYMERPSGYHPDGSHNIAGSFNLVSRVWTHLDTPSGLFCSGHSVLSNGSVIIMGGHIANAGFPDGRWSIRTYTLDTPALINVTNMRYPRWYATVTLLPDERVMVMGGTQGVGAGTANNPYYEIWDPQAPDTTEQFQVLPSYLTTVKQNYYPFNYILPSGDMFNYCARIGWILDPYTGTYKVPLPGRPLSIIAPSVVYITQYPYTGTSVMLPLLPENNYTVEVMIIGGQNLLANNNLNLVACQESLRIQIFVPNATSPSYAFSKWVTEQTGSPRVMGDSVLLPNGNVILLNGAMEGLAGDAASGGGSKAFYPNFFAEMYVTYNPVGQRWFTLSRSQIPRLYHSTVALTTNGTILVTGCDRCGDIITNMTFSPSPAKAEYRNEIFYPPPWYDFANKPNILSAPAEVQYGQVFTVSYSGLTAANVSVTSAVFVAPSSVTHCFNTNQRVVKLVLTVNPYAKTLSLVAPPTPNHAPPQYYMLFLLNGDTYSSAAWVKLSLS